MAKRMQSPSSINTYKLCPRKYFYSYILKLETQPNIHLLRGGIAHSVLEDFFKIDVRKLPFENYEYLLRGLIIDFLSQQWQKAKKELTALNLTEAQSLFYYDETEKMLLQWLKGFLKKLHKENIPFADAFKKWTPRTEEEYRSEKHQVRGFIDAIHEFDDHILLMDYKTSNKEEITVEYRLQLAIYALLYKETHGKLPHQVGIDFLRFGERHLEVTDNLISFAAEEIAVVHSKTESDDKKDYPRNMGPWCKWHSGQCDFYDQCFHHGKPRTE